MMLRLFTKTETLPWLEFWKNGLPNASLPTWRRVRKYEQVGKTIRELFPEDWGKPTPMPTFRIPAYFDSIPESPEV